MIGHVGHHKRVATRTSTPDAGNGPLLRALTRHATMRVMADDTRIDVPKLRRAVQAWIADTPKASRRSLSLKASDGRNPDLVRDLFRVDKRLPQYDTVADLARAMDQDVAEFVVGAAPNAVSGEQWLTVCGTVEAGAWHEYREWPRDDWFQIEVTGSELFRSETGLMVQGRSMDKSLPPGTFLKCVPMIGSGLEMQDGDYVIVERMHGALRELTCKRLIKRPDGDWELRAESTLPEFQEPLFVGKPIEGDEAVTFDALNDEETRVTAIVVDAYLPLQRRRKRAFA